MHNERVSDQGYRFGPVTSSGSCSCPENKIEITFILVLQVETTMFIKFKKSCTNAVTPSRAHPSDIGMDLVAIRKHKVYPSGTVLYDTGIAAVPPPGYYLEILPRSSISRTGWMLANSVGTIDPSYTGNLFIALTQVNENAPEPELPFCVCQIVLRKAEYAEMQEVNELVETERGDGAFGSTGDRSA